MNIMTDIKQWYRDLPRFTRFWLTATVVLSLISRFNILPLKYTYLSRYEIFHNLQLWRLFTSLFVYPLTSSTGFHFLINCYFITQYGVRLERDQFGRTPADFLYLQMVVGALANIGGLVFNVYFLMDLVVVAITYIWCQLNKGIIISFWFGTRFKAMYLPWVLAGMEIIFQGSFASLIGIFVGHVYHFFKFRYPEEFGGSVFLETPNIIKQYVPDLNGGFGTFGAPPSRSQEQQRAPGNAVFGNNWGRGNTLGH